jgi:ribose 5-phosphate isomerase B
MKNIPIIIGADHAGFALKEKIKLSLAAKQVTLRDLTPTFVDGDDYPKVGFDVARAVSKNPKARGILVCGSGIGIAIAANRINGARAFDAHSVEEVKLAREHNDANVIVLSGWKMKNAEALKMIEAFLTTPFSKVVRHKRRVKELG